MRTKFTRFKTMNMNFTWSTTQKGEKAIRYNDYLYRLKRENQNGSVVYVCTIKCCGHLITLKNDVIIKSDSRCHNHAPKLSNNVQAVLTRLKRRVLIDDDQSIGKIYDEEVKKFVSICSFLCIPINDYFCSFFSAVKMVQLLPFQFLTHGNQIYIVFVEHDYLQ